MDAKLFSPLTIRSVSLKNRIVVSPMCQYSSVDGFANDWHLVHLGSRAVGGAGLVFTEATAVAPEGRISPDDLGIWKDEHIEQLKRITTFIELQGAVAGIQLAHAGRKASVHSAWKGGQQAKPGEDGWQTVAPSALPFNETDMVPHELTPGEIGECVADFGAAARRAKLAGFKVIEIHAAHGYLLNEFLSPLSNHRNDQYGGSFENRCRFLFEVIDAIKKEWPDDLPLFVRISSTDWTDGGWTIEDSVRLGNDLKAKSIDLIDCSSGGNVPKAKIAVGSGYQVPFAAAVKRGAEILTGAVGMIDNAAQAEKILNDGDADLIFLAREFLRDPYFPLHAAKALSHDAEWPVQYQRAKR
jgi:2,4-dienoyl-CoA reductase-like NADH-dependent reductase (Old Yellow Enzyme family)